MQRIRSILAIILSVLIVQGMAVLAGRFVADIWYFYLFQAIQVQAAIGLLVAGLVVFLLRPSAYAVIQMAAAGALAVHGWVALGEFAHEPPAGAKPVLKVITFNILGSNNANGPAIADMLIASGADVLMIQESAPLGPQIPRIKAVYPYRLGCGAKTITCDLSLWSKRPLDQAEVSTISPIHRDRFMTAVIDVDGRKIRLVTAHMTKPYFDEAHAVEMKKLAAAINATSEPLVLGGDFNASILAPDVSRMLRTANLKTASWEPATWPVEFVKLGTAIDHLLVREPLAIAEIRRLDSNHGSNHFGLVAELALP